MSVTPTVQAKPSATVASDVAGDVFFGNYNFKINNNYGSIVYHAPKAPTLRRHVARPHPPRAPSDFHDRAAELAQIEQVIKHGKAVALCGANGVGKSTLLRQAANTPDARAMPDGVILVEGLNGQGEWLQPDDIAQRLFDTFYLSDPPLRVNVVSAQPHLSQLHALLVLDHVTLNADQLRSLFDLFPESPLLVACSAALPGLARPIPIGPLPHDDAIEVLAANSGLRPDGAERPTLDAICALLNDVPLAIVRVASAICVMKLPVDQVRQCLAAIPPAGGDPVSIGLRRALTLIQAMLTPLEKQVLNIGAWLPGFSIDPQMIVDIMCGSTPSGASAQIKVGPDWVDIDGVRLSRHVGQDAEAFDTVESTPVREAIEAAIAHLKTLGLLQASSPRLRLDPAFRDLLRGPADEESIGDRLLARLLSDRLEGRFDDDAYCAAELGHVLGAIDWAVQRQHWSAAITLSRAIDRYVMLHGLWNAWRQIADRVWQSARAAGDRSVEAWALHQLGTRAIGSDKAQAIDLLTQALSLRHTIGETTAAAYTQHNLDVLIPPIVPPKSGEGSIGPTGMSGAMKAILVVAVVGVMAVAGYLLWQALLVPSLVLPRDISQEASGPSGAIVDFAATAQDRSDGPLPVTCQPSSGSTFALGQTTVNCEARNHFGFTARGSFHVTIHDTTEPQIDVPKDTILEAASPEGRVVDFTASVNDLVDRVEVVCLPPSGSIFPADKTIVTCTAEDTHGNTGQASFLITVQDTTRPQVDVPKDMILEATSPEGRVADFTASASDLVDDKVEVICQPSSGSIFPLDKTTTVICTAKDTHGNTDQASFSIMVQDTTGPQVDVPKDMILEATSPDGSVADFTASASDWVDGKVEATCQPSSGWAYPLDKTTTVTCTAKDAHGNTDQASFSIMVQDTTGPQVDVLKDMILEATSPDGSVADFTASASDLVDGKVEATCQPTSGLAFPLDKMTTVTCTAKDLHGNTGQADFSITVQDTTGPQVDVPKDMFLEATSPAGGLAYFTAAASDVVDGKVEATCQPPSGSAFALGTTTVNCAAKDSHTNTGQASFSIMVQDTTGPQVDVPKDMILEATSSAGSLAYFTTSASDVVDGKFEATCQPSSGSTFPACKTTAVTCTAKDFHDNYSQAGFSITVQDTTLPQLDVPGEMTLEATSPEGSVAFYSVSATDLGQPASVSCNYPTGSTFKRGTTTVKCKATDACYNTREGQFRVIVQDTKTPAISLIQSTENQVYYASPDCGPTSFNVYAAVTDASGISSVHLRYRYVPDGKNPKAWLEPKMVKMLNSDIYGAPVPVNAEGSTYLNGFDGKVEYQIVAVDKAGKVSSSGMRSVIVRYCFG